MTRIVTTGSGRKIIMIGSLATAKKVTTPEISTSTVKPVPRPERKAEEKGEDDEKK